MFSQQHKVGEHIGVNKITFLFPSIGHLSALHSGMKSAISSVHSLTNSAGILWAPARKVLVNQRDTALGLATSLDGNQVSLWCPPMAATGFYKFIISHTFGMISCRKKIIPFISILLVNVEPPNWSAPLPLSYSTHPSQSLQVARTTLAFNYHHYHPQSWEAFVSLPTLWRRRIQMGSWGDQKQCVDMNSYFAAYMVKSLESHLSHQDLFIPDEASWVKL